jgi:hypothetical protein
VQSDRINWLEELLPRKFPKARVMVFAHNADWFLGAPQRTSQESAGDLLLYLKEKRKDIKVRTTDLTQCTQPDRIGISTYNFHCP